MSFDLYTVCSKDCIVCVKLLDIVVKMCRWTNLEMYFACAMWQWHYFLNLLLDLDYVKPKTPSPEFTFELTLSNKHIWHSARGIAGLVFR